MFGSQWRLCPGQLSFVPRLSLGLKAGIYLILMATLIANPDSSMRFPRPRAANTLAEYQNIGRGGVAAFGLMLRSFTFTPLLIAAARLCRGAKPPSLPNIRHFPNIGFAQCGSTVLCTLTRNKR
jgi:hypothetical protein